MAKHITHIRMESRVGMVHPDYRAICDCGWQDKSLTRESAEDLARSHAAKALYRSVSRG